MKIKKSAVIKIKIFDNDIMTFLSEIEDSDLLTAFSALKFSMNNEEPEFFTIDSYSACLSIVAYLFFLIGKDYLEEYSVFSWEYPRCLENDSGSENFRMNMFFYGENNESIKKHVESKMETAEKYAQAMLGEETSTNVVSHMKNTFMNMFKKTIASINEYTEDSDLKRFFTETPAPFVYFELLSMIVHRCTVEYDINGKNSSAFGFPRMENGLRFTIGKRNSDAYAEIEIFA